MSVNVVAVVTTTKLTNAANKTGEDEGRQMQCSTKGTQNALMLFPFQCVNHDSSVHLNFAQQKSQWLANPKLASFAELGEKVMKKK